ncbi:hypothetical protein NC797_07170 [Aquibacillus sp. 3ASR75-11]|uniref:Uncharacterized protein n=1 Tax=Terrihalobacillus insolitus TaxID=2950438 RepID=A0A9X3WSZ5_9BACI|nr:hypothetical protein [Terrihalobacillus insolitus]MDC3424288.1 hypothetical protein [Terrihalobacillus insolitus]
MIETANKEDLFTYTEKKLSSHFQNSGEFNRFFKVMYDYYSNKLNVFIKVEDKEVYESKLFQSAKSQFFNGYYIVREFLADENTNLPDEWLSQPEGFITEEIPGIIKSAAGNNFEEVILSEDMHNLILWAVTRYEDLHALLKQTAFDIVCLGAKQAILDERDNKGIPKPQTAIPGLLGDFDDFMFLTPQHYFQAEVKTDETEIWSLNWWSSLAKEDSKAGEVTLIKIPGENNVQYALNLYLTKEIDEHERERILALLLMTLMDKNDIPRNDIMVRFAVVEDFYILVQE